MNQDIKTKLAKICAQTKLSWAKALLIALVTIRCSLNQSTGFTPCELLTGKQFPGPATALILGKETEEYRYKLYFEELRTLLSGFDSQVNKQKREKNLGHPTQRRGSCWKSSRGSGRNQGGQATELGRLLQDLLDVQADGGDSDQQAEGTDTQTNKFSWTSPLGRQTSSDTRRNKAQRPGHRATYLVEEEGPQTKGRVTSLSWKIEARWQDLGQDEKWGRRLCEDKTSRKEDFAKTKVQEKKTLRRQKLKKRRFCT